MTAINLIRAMIADDSYAATFQTMGQYRSALLMRLKVERVAPVGPPSDEEIDEIAWAWYSKTGSTWYQVEAFRAFARAVLARYGSPQPVPVALTDADVVQALAKAEAALADIGDSEREPGDDLKWCERRAAETLPVVREALSFASTLPMPGA